MSILRDELPEEVVRAVKAASFAEFATVSAKGIPIDTPLLSFPDEDLSRIGMATGLAYPVKAERARRNPKVGLLYHSGLPDEPVVQLAGHAAIRDSDIEGNIRRYVSETGYVTPEVPWSIKRNAVWYWARIIIEITPVEVTWWENPAALDGKPSRWRAPEGISLPQSDPAPPKPPTSAPKWDQPSWQAAARPNVDNGFPACVSLVDKEGYPRVAHARNLTLEEDGFLFDLPPHSPGLRNGRASLTYFGKDTFVGDVSEAGDRLKLKVERALPILPLLGETNVFDPRPEVRDALLARLRAELDRRGSPMPSVPEDMPELTKGALRRAERDTRGADEAIFQDR